MSTQVRRFRLLVAELQAAREQLAEQAVSEERRRIAAELHDLVGHSLTVVLLHLTGARRRIRADPEGAEQALAEAEEIGRRSLAEIRRNVALLRGDGARTGTAPTPGARDVPELVASAASAGGDVRLAVHETLGQVIPAVRAEAEKLGRDPRSIEMTVGGARTVAEAEVMAKLGADRCTIAIRSKDPAAVRDEIGTFGADVIAPTRDL